MSQTKNKSHLAALGIGVSCRMAESDSRNKHSWSAAPPSPVLSVMRAVRGATPSARTHVLNRASGHFDPDDTGAAVGLLRAAARHWSVPWTSGAVAGSGCFDASGMGRGPRWFPRAATRVVQHAGAPSRDRCAGSYRGTGQGTRSPRTAGESHVPGVGLRHRRRHGAPLGGLFARRRALKHGAWLALIRPAGPTRKWSRRA